MSRPELDGTAPQALASEESRRRSLYTSVDLDMAALERSTFALALIRRQQGAASALGNFAETLITKASESYAQIFQDLFALHMSGGKRGGFFVEVGTGDGILISNTYLLEKVYGWQGIVVEPNPVFHQSLLNNRACAVMTDCVLDVTGRTVSFDCTLEPEFSGINQELGDRPVSSSDVAERERPVQTIELTTVSLNDLLTRANAPAQIDFLSLDVEGAELTILSTFDFDRWQIGCLTIEHNFDARREDIYKLLESKGYYRVFPEISQWDDWYVSADLLRARPDAADLLPAEAAMQPAERAQALVRWVARAMEQGDFDIARTLCYRAIEIAPRLPDPRRMLDEIAERDGQGADLPPPEVAPPADRAHAFVRWATRAVEQGDFDVARTLCHRAVEIGPQLSDPYRTLAEIAQREGQVTVAVRHWRRAVDLAPGDYWAHIGLADLLIATGKQNEATAILEHAVTLSEQPTRATELLGRIGSKP